MVVANDEDKTEQNIIESHLKRECRALGNIIVVDEKMLVKRLTVNILTIKLTDGRKDSWISIASVI